MRHCNVIVEDSASLGPGEAMTASWLTVIETRWEGKTTTTTTKTTTTTTKTTTTTTSLASKKPESSKVESTGTSPGTITVTGTPAATGTGNSTGTGTNTQLSTLDTPQPNAPSDPSVKTPETGIPSTGSGNSTSTSSPSSSGPIFTLLTGGAPTRPSPANSTTTGIFTAAGSRAVEEACSIQYLGFALAVFWLAF